MSILGDVLSLKVFDPKMGAIIIFNAKSYTFVKIHIIS